MTPPLAPADLAGASPWAAAFTGGRHYLAAATTGLPPRAALAAMRSCLDEAEAGRPDVAAYSAAVESSRSSFARLVGVTDDRVAIGTQASVMAALVATAVPEGGEVLVPEGEFSSMVLPFHHSGRRLRVRTAPLASLADAVRPETALVAFSLAQSATGEVADDEAIVAAARRHDALTLCDLSQAAGWKAIDASRFDATTTHAYKWLCCPRGVGFLTLGARIARAMTPLAAGWYAGEDPWASCYGAPPLASDARRFDISPSWQAFVGAAPALAIFADADAAAVEAYTTGLATRFRAAIGLAEPARPSPIVTWPDPDGTALSRLTAAGITASGRAGRARVAFHVFNDVSDVDDAAVALTRPRA